MNITITGHVVHVPSEPLIAGSPAPGAVYAPADAHLLLGRKRLFAKEPAARLAMMATHEALAESTSEPRPGDLPTRTAVVVASMLSNSATVCRTVTHTAARGTRGLSALAAPNASGNIIASSVAIRFGFTGPSVLVTSGATSGIDAVRVAARLLRAKRADRVVVIGVEPVDATTATLTAGLVEGAGCVILEPDIPGHPVLGAFDYTPSLPATHGRHPVAGHFHAASGVIQLASTCADPVPARGVIVWAGNEDDGYASLRLHAPVSPPAQKHVEQTALVGAAPFGESA